MATQSESGEATTMTVEVSTEIDRPVAEVFEFFAENHVENHPRWDPNMELEKETDGPIGVGTVIRRRNTNYDEPREGTMEVVEFEPNEVMRTVIKEAGMEIPGRATFEELGAESTRLALSAEFPDSLDRDLIQQNMERSTWAIKELIESEFDVERHPEAEPYEIITNGLVGQEYRLLETGTDELGEYLLMEIIYETGGEYFPEHVHPRQDKTFKVTEGEFVVTIEGERRVYVTGDEGTIPAGVPQLYYAGDATAHVLWKIRPPMAFDELFRMTSSLAHAGKTKPDGTPSMLSMAVFLHEHPDMVYLTKLPIGVQKALFALLSPIGRLFGHQAHFPGSESMSTVE